MQETAHSITAVLHLMPRRGNINSRFPSRPNIHPSFVTWYPSDESQGHPRDPCPISSTTIFRSRLFSTFAHTSALPSPKVDQMSSPPGVSRSTPACIVEVLQRYCQWMHCKGTGTHPKEHFPSRIQGEQCSKNQGIPMQKLHQSPGHHQGYHSSVLSEYCPQCST